MTKEEAISLLGGSVAKAADAIGINPQGYIPVAAALLHKFFATSPSIRAASLQLKGDKNES